MGDTHLLPPLSPAEARHIDQTCDRFEAAWKAGPRPDLREYLGATAGNLRSALLRQLLLLDWDYRRRAGDGPRAGDYHRQFPDDTALIEAVGRQLQHPAIVPVYELGQFRDGQPYFTMKLVEGHTLAKLLGDRKNVGQDSSPDRARQDWNPDPQTDLPRLLGVFAQVCQAMAY